MKLISILLTTSVVVGLITGIALIIPGKIALASVIFSITLILFSIEQRAAMHRKKKGNT